MIGAAVKVMKIATGEIREDNDESRKNKISAEIEHNASKSCIN